MKKSAAILIVAVTLLFCPGASKQNAEQPNDAIQTVDSIGCEAERFIKLEKDLKQTPFDKKKLSEYYRAAIKLKKYDDADKALKRLCELDEKNQKLAANRIALLRLAKKYTEAEFVGKKLLFQQSSNSEGLNNLALVYLDLHRYDKALELIETAEKINPTDLRIKLNKARILSEAGRTKQAERILNKILLKNPTYLKAINNEGALKYVSGETEGGELSFIQASEGEPPLLEAQINKAIADLNNGEYEKAYRQLQEIEYIQPKNLTILRAQSAALLYMGRYEEAERKAKEALADNREDAELLILKGSALFMQEKYEEAEEAFTQALWFDPDNEQANGNLALCFKKQALFTKAELFLKAALEKRPYNADLHYNLATVYEGRGKNMEAIKEFKKYIELSPGAIDKDLVLLRIKELEKIQKPR